MAKRSENKDMGLSFQKLISFAYLVANVANFAHVLNVNFIRGVPGHREDGMSITTCVVDVTGE